MAKKLCEICGAKTGGNKSMTEHLKKGTPHNPVKERAAAIREARKAIEAHDAAMKRQREAEQKLKKATRRYAVAHDLWGFTPTMLRAALARMEQEQAA